MTSCSDIRERQVSGSGPAVGYFLDRARYSPSINYRPGQSRTVVAQSVHDAQMQMSRHVCSAAWLKSG